MLDILRANSQSWIVKVLFGMIIIVFVFMGVGSFSSNPVNLVARVDGEPILIRDFELAYKREAEQLLRENPSVTSDDLKAMGFRGRVFSGLVLNILLDKELARLGITISPVELRQDIGQRYAEFQDEQGRFDSKKYLAALAAINISPGEFEKNEQARLMRTKLLQYLSSVALVTEAEAKALYSFSGEMRSLDYIAFPIANYAANATVTDAQIASFYQNNTSAFVREPLLALEYIALTPETLAATVEVSEEELRAQYALEKERYATGQVRDALARTIYLPVAKNATAAEDAQAKTAIEAAATALTSGQDFAAVAQNLYQNGAAVLVSEGDFAPELQAVLFNLQPGQVSAPVKAAAGYYLFALESWQDATVPTFDVMRDRLMRLLLQGRVQTAMQKSMTAGSDALAEGKSMEEVASVLRLPMHSTNGSIDRMIALEAVGISDVQAIAQLTLTPVGEAVDMPLPVRGGGYAFVRVTDKQPESTYSLEEVSEQITTFLRATNALGFAKDDATRVLESIKAEGVSGSMEAALQRSAAFGRNGGVPLLDTSPQLLHEAFSVADGTWLPSVYASADAELLLIARVASVSSPSDQEWDIVKEAFAQQMQQQEAAQVLDSYLGILRNQAAVEVFIPDVLVDR